jgi:excisionase family DNA binding protein
MSATKVKFESFDAATRRQAEQVISDLASGRASLAIAGALADIIKQVVTMAAEAGGIAFGPVSAELSPEMAGKILGVSRPLVVRRMDDGRLPYHYVGSHRRCRLDDVLKLKAKEETANAALAQIYEEVEELENGPHA